MARRTAPFFQTDLGEWNVQLVVDDGVSAACWQTVFTLMKKNTLTGFKAKGP